MNFDLIHVLETNPVAAILLAALMVYGPMTAMLGVVLNFISRAQKTSNTAAGQGNAALVRTLNEISEEVTYLRKVVHDKDALLLEIQKQQTQLTQDLTQLRNEHASALRTINDQQTLITELRNQLHALVSVLKELRTALAELGANDLANVITESLTGLGLDS